MCQTLSMACITAWIAFRYAVLLSRGRPCIVLHDRQRFDLEIQSCRTPQLHWLCQILQVAVSSIGFHPNSAVVLHSSTSLPVCVLALLAMRSTVTNSELPRPRAPRWRSNAFVSQRTNRSWRCTTVRPVVTSSWAGTTAGDTCSIRSPG